MVEFGVVVLLAARLLRPPATASEQAIPPRTSEVGASLQATTMVYYRFFSLHQVGAPDIRDIHGAACARPLGIAVAQAHGPRSGMRLGMSRLIVDHRR